MSFAQNVLAQTLQAVLQNTGRLGRDQVGSKAVNKALQSENPRQQVRFEDASAAGGKLTNEQHVQDALARHIGTAQATARLRVSILSKERRGKRETRKGRERERPGERESGKTGRKEGYIYLD